MCKTLKMICAAALTVAMIGSQAQAKMQAWQRSGGWVNYAGTVNDGSKSCAMGILGDEGREVQVKYWRDNDSLGILLLKPSWRIPDGTSINVELGFDGAHYSDGKATGLIDRIDQTNYVFIDLNGYAADFLDNFADAKFMQLHFPDGSEADWRVRMVGSRNALNAFGYCVTKLRGMAATTQPFGAPKTQPFGNNDDATLFNKKPIGESF
jgi:hypothetical protein